MRSLGLTDIHDYMQNRLKKNKVLLYNTGNYIEYLVVTYNGKESEKNIITGIYMHIYIYIQPMATVHEATQSRT